MQTQTTNSAAQAGSVASATSQPGSTPGAATIIGEIAKDAAVETKAADTKAAGQDSSKAGEKAATETAKGTEGANKAEGDKAPPTEIELKLPDGVQADAELLGSFKATAKEVGLDSARAQKVLDLYVKAQSAAVEKAQAEHVKQVTEWRKAIENHKDFGGAAFEASKADARRAVSKFGSPELAKVLDEYGLGNHPELFALLARAGKALAEDSVAGSTSTSRTVSDAEAKLRASYPSMFKE